MLSHKQKFYLFKQSNHFCAVPWNYLKVSMDGTVTTCVRGRQKIGNICHNNIEEILANEQLQDIRSNLVQDKSHSNCNDCQAYEIESKYKYLRGLYNPMFQNATVDYYDPNGFVLSGIDLHWSSTCNLKCITCWSQQSSSIAQEEGKPILHTPSEHAEKLTDFIINNQTTLKEIYLSGGEPTLIKHNLKLLKLLRKDLNFQLRVNTNLMFESTNPIIQELKKFPNVLFTISADATGERFDYIRRGADWKIFVANLNELHNMHFKWRVNSVFFVASAIKLPETQQFFMDNYGIEDFTINQLDMGHTVIHSKNLSVKNKELCEKNLMQHMERYSTNKNLCGQVENCLKELALPGSPNYHEYFDSIDRKAGTNWRKVFEELR